MLKTISFHPKFAAVIDALSGAALLFFLARVGNWWWLLLWVAVRFLVWALLVRLVYYPPEVNRWRHLFSLCFFGLGLVCFLIFMEWTWSWNIFGFLFVILPAVSFWLLPPRHGGGLVFAAKPHRRWLLFMDVLGLSGLWSGLHAIYSFQIFYNINYWVWIILGTAVTAVVSIWWWREYKIAYSRKFSLGLIILILFVLELSWIVFLWPLGYLASALFTVWLWYLLWLVLRFHLSGEGVDWRKQWLFLTINLILVGLFLLFIVKWR